MKKTTMMLLMLFAGMVSATADNTVSVGTALIPQGNVGTISIELTNTDAFASSMEVHLTLPEGITFEGVALSNRFTDAPTVGKKIEGQAVTITTLSSSNEAIEGNSGPLLFVTVSADEALEVGDKLTASVTMMELAKKVAGKHEKWNPEPFDFEIEISDRILLNEGYTWTPYATDAACDLKVTRTIKANEWSTVCFPFAMSADKLKAAFGDDYDLEEFTGYDVEKDGDNVVGITMNFTRNTKAAKINTPYIIKTTRDISEFEVNAKVNPGNTKKSIVIEDDETGEEVEIASMTGTYAAGTVVPKNSLFLSGNKFYYSVGKTKMKAFRAYFTLSVVLSDVSQAAARVSFFVGNEDTGISSMHNAQCLMHNEVYDLQGRRMNSSLFTHHSSLKKGLYIKNGRKEVVR
jgi:hypothetical protein